MPAITRAQLPSPPAEQPRGLFFRAQQNTPPAEQPRGSFIRLQCPTPPALRPRASGAYPTNAVLFRPFNTGLQ